jgi:AcrR family transcriptional regulator
MKTRKRFTREESKEATRARLIEAAQRIFIAKGFDDAPVEEIAETAGFSRGAFYSNFADKDELLVAVFDKHRTDIVNELEGVLRRFPTPHERIAALREWFTNQWRQRNFVSLRLEFSGRAMRNRAVRKRLSEMARLEFETYAAAVAQCFEATGLPMTERPQTIALALMAVVLGLGSIARGSDAGMDQLCDEAAKLVFERLSGTPNSLKDNSIA